ncbi:hypothetical protein P43SY_006255 [Pythium insidiosum]|uniref:FYVE-type domain-containing protein n=1 Tax=Pythium insidiosum TaxID=114742 RepID=A0AAD5Q7K2_PYTIN|nr:hypothetical protein P43SY_006255 [Pythium insidiosum]
MSRRGPASSLHSQQPPPPPQEAGLVVQVGNGYERLVLSAHEICEDVVATLPKLQSAARRDTYGRRWKPRRRKNGVDLFELAPGGGDDVDDDLDIAHALVAKSELRCHLNEVLNVLINQDSGEYEATMRALCGNKFKRGQVLLEQRRYVPTPSLFEDDDGGQDALVGVQMMTLRPKLRVKLQTKHKRTQKLCFATCTQQNAAKTRAIHIMKTLPKDAHDQIVASQDRSALRRELDHVAVGLDIRTQASAGAYGSSSHTTRIFLHTYTSTVAPSEFGLHDSKTPGVSYAVADLARRREAIMNPEARHVMELLTKSLRDFETVIRRRRFGFQTFIYFPTAVELHGGNSSSSAMRCTICQKHFSFFRRDYFCQLCGHMVCKECSKLYDVEARVGEIRQNRCCIRCVVRVDACVFEDHDIVPALGPVVVDADEAAWLEQPSLTDNDDETLSVASSGVDELAGNLYSDDPSQRSLALEQLAQLVGPLDKKPTQPKHVLRDVENHLSQSLRRSRARYQHADECVVYDNERDYTYAFDPSKTRSPDVPLAPMPDAHKEQRRLELIAQSGVLDTRYDRSALDLLAQVAAKRLNCALGFISVVDETHFRAIGTYQFPEVAMELRRDENLCMHSVYAEKPMIVKNPQRDMRFAQMPCIKDLGVKFYAGFPVCAPDGTVVASLCTGDVVPHNNITTKEYATMEALSKLAADLIVPAQPKPVAPQQCQHQRMAYGATDGNGARAPPQPRAKGGAARPPPPQYAY